MNRRMQIIIGAAVAVVVLLAVAIVLGVNAYTSNKAEERLDHYLREFGAQDYVQWHSVKHSLFGKTTLNDVVIADSFYIKKLEISDAKLTDKKATLRVKVTDFANQRTDNKFAMNYSDLRGFDWASYVLAGGLNPLPPARFELTVQADRAKDSGAVDLEYQLPDAAKGQINWTLNQGVNALVRFIENPNSTVPSQGGFFGLGNQADLPFAQLFMLGEVFENLKVSETRLQYEDEGLIQRIQANIARYALPTTTEEADPKQRLKAVQKAVHTELQQLCENAGLSWLRDNPPKQRCAAFERLVDGKKATFMVQYHPAVSPWQAEVFNTRYFERNSNRWSISLN